MSACNRLTTLGANAKNISRDLKSVTRSNLEIPRTHHTYTQVGTSNWDQFVMHNKESSQGETNHSQIERHFKRYHTTLEGITNWKPDQTQIGQEKIVVKHKK